MSSQSSKSKVITESSRGDLSKVPGEIFTFWILRFIKPNVVLCNICLVNNFFKNCCLSEDLWNFFLKRYNFNEFVEINENIKPLNCFKELYFYWRTKKKKFFPNFKFEKNNMEVTSKKGWKKNSPNLLCHTERTFFKKNQIFRIKFLTSNHSGSFVGIAERVKNSEKIHYMYHNDGSISVSQYLRDEKEEKLMKLENRIKMIDVHKNGFGKNLKVFYPIERDAILNIFVDYTGLKIYSFMENSFKQNICVSVPPNFFEKELGFVFGLNKKQKVRILPNLKFENFKENIVTKLYSL